MSHQSPFRNNRYELEEDRRHVYFLLSGDLEQLEQLKSNYIVGTRGTGKTTLLKSLSWRERLHSPSLKQALGGDPRFDRYLGVYLKLPEFQLAQFEEWLTSAPSRLHATLTSLYLDLIWIEALLDAVEEMRSRQLLEFSIEEEASFVRWQSEWWERRGGGSLLPESGDNLLTLKENIFRVRNELEAAAVAEIEPAELVSEIPVGQVGQLGRDAGAKLRELCEGEGQDQPQWHIRICLDEAEVLADQQQLVLNTMVRLSGFPLYFVVAFAAMPRDVSSTLLPNQTLSEADRHLDNRDNMKDDKFERLTEGVCQSRVNAMLDESDVFDLERLLGPLELDRLAADSLARSESAEVTGLLERAQKLAELRGTATPPVLELYLAEMEEREPEPHPTRRERSKGIRKKAPAVYISLLRRYGFNVRYASAPMVLQLSDGCIRDFLSQMDELFVQRDQPLREFMKLVRVPLAEQDAAFKRASYKKRQNLVRRVEESPPEEVERVVDGLARITAGLQAHIAPPEPGRFVLKLDKAGEGDGGAEGNGDSKGIGLELGLLQEANHTGYLRVLKETRERIEFRVHTSLAPTYGFSYRGAYYEVPLLASDLSKLRKASDDAVASAVVKDIMQRFSAPASASLFETPESPR